MGRMNGMVFATSLPKGAHNIVEMENICDTICEMDAGELTQIKASL